MPVCPYSKSKAQNRRNPQVSDVTLKHGSESKTGVEFRWYTKAEYAALNPSQRQELYQWQQSKDGQAQIKKSKEEKEKKGGGSKSQPSTKKLKSQISSMEKQLQSVSSRLDTLGEDSVMVSDIAAAIVDNAPASW